MIDRRFLLKTGALALVSAGAGPRFLERLALATTGPAPFTRRKTLVTIFLRGAMDGLAAVPPVGDPSLERLRPGLALSAAGSGALADLDGRYGLHPSFAPLLPYWNDGRLAIVHGVGSPDPTRSHFDAQDFMETGTPGRKGTLSGWLNRTARAAGPSASPLRAVALSPELPRSLYGPEPAVAVEDLARLALAVPRDPGLGEITADALAELYRAAEPGLLRRRGREMLSALEVLRRGDLANDRATRGVLYPSSPLGNSLHQIAFLLRAGVGLEIASAESDGWDTHIAQGSEAGTFARRADDLARCVAAFWQDIEPFHDDVIVLTMTEFGRTVAQNGSGGTDHGHGSCLFVLGNGVDGGRVYGELGSLEPDALFEGRDLPVTTDFRAVFAEVAGKLFGIRDDGVVFPGWSGRRLRMLW